VTKYIAGLFAAFALATVAFAAPPAEHVFTAKNGNVTFKHEVHKALDCTKCHADAKGGKIELGKDKAHGLCQECHKTGGKGPTKCNECHKKA
jgi:predicted CXXCH cytochrome family protein